jgi:hypothetical protein
MTCPKCGAKIEEGMLLCSRCGCEIKYVPDFDPELENSISETLSGVVADIGWDDEDDNLDEELLSQYGLGDETKRLPTQEIPVKSVKKRIPTQEINKDRIRKITDEKRRKGGARPSGKPGSAQGTRKGVKPDTKPKKHSDDDFDDIPDDFWDVEEALDFTGSGRIFTKIKNSTAAKIVAILAGCALLGIIIFAAVFISGKVKRNSFEYKYNLAKEYYAKGDYAHAVSYMESAANMHSDDLTVQYELAEYYSKNNQTQNAILTYRNIIRDFDSDVLTAYTKLFEIYESQGDFESINSVLSECTNKDIVNQFQRYLAVAPEFSAVPGSYDDPVYLKLTANPSGQIFYTIDGSTPDNESLEYTSPLYLEKGAFQIKAIYINSYGLMSPVAEGDFQINVSAPNPPTINLDSGEMEKPELIVVEDIPEDCVVYYTSDGSEPTKDSNVYKNPILMPIGSSTFQFVTYNFDDVPSEIVTREYLYLVDEDKVSAAQAANIITTYRFNSGNGTMAGTDGSLTYLSGRLMFMCESAVILRDTVYYVITEYYEDPNAGSTTKTGYMYAVSTKDENDYGLLKAGSDGNYIYTRVN